MRMNWGVRSAGVWLVVLVAALPGCGTWGQPTSASVFEPGEAYIAKLVHDLAHPSMEGRDAGTEGLIKARDYLIDHLERSGLQPAFGDAYTQSFDVALGIYAPTQTLAFGTGNPNLTQAVAGEHFEAMGFSANGSFSGQPVFVGYGVVSRERQYDSFADVGDDLQGKVAIAFRYEPMTGQGRSKWTKREGRWSDAARFEEKARLAADRGATAMLIVDPPARELSGSLRNAANTANVGRTTIPVYHISASLLREMLAKAGRDVDATLNEWQRAADEGAVLDALDNLTVAGEVEIASKHATTDNVAGILRGHGDLADQVVFVGAHYDHVGYGAVGSRSGTHEIHHGADDNASGTAAVLVLAKRFAERYQASPQTPRRTIVFAFFAAEERGLLGSDYLVKNLDDMGIRQDQIVAMLNMDMVGRVSDNKFYVLGVGTGDSFETLVTQTNKEVGFNLTTQPALPGNSDHAHFIRRQIPALHFFSGFHPDYHMPSDTADKVNYPDLVRAVRLIDGVLEALVTQIPAVAYIGREGGGTTMQHTDPHAAASPEEQARIADQGGRARLGIMPDYATAQGVDGAGVGDVIADPAKSAGLQAGDVIVQWNDTAIGNVEQLSAMLHRASPGDEVTLTIIRDGARQQIKLTLSGR